jgi:23S rRNA (pseudouridine1915-N3)-methyltransferase
MTLNLYHVFLSKSLVLKLAFLSVGRTNEPYVKEGIDNFTKRITHYYPIQWQLIAPAKVTDPDQIKKAEAQSILKALSPNDVVILLDETGKMLSSPGLAKLIQQKANQSAQRIVFLIGGAYGVANELKERAQFTWSLSELVFPHMLVRLILAEQVYRACSILANEKYHHE